jgi:hypothetical protein
LRELFGKGLDASGAALGQQLPSLGSRSQSDNPSIVLVRLPGDEPADLERANEARHRGRLDLFGRCELAERQWSTKDHDGKR